MTKVTVCFNFCLSHWNCQ